MFPITLDIAALEVALVGEGPATERRLESLVEAGARNLRIFSDVPAEEKLDGVQVIFAGDLNESQAKKLAKTAKKKGILLNIEDTTKWCNFHVPAIVRRGDLLVTSSTGGKSPRLARKIREKLEEIFSEEWEERLDFLAKERTRWKKHGAGMKEVAAKTDEILKRKGWF